MWSVGGGGLSWPNSILSPVPSLLGTRGAVLHHSAETVLCFGIQIVLLLSCHVRLSATGKDDLPMV